MEKLNVKKVTIELTDEQYKELTCLFEDAQAYYLNTGKKGMVLGQAWEYEHGGGHVVFGFVDNETIMKLGTALSKKATEQNKAAAHGKPASERGEGV